MEDVKELDNESFDELLRKLEENVDVLESGEVPLEKALEVFEEGIKLSKELTRRLVAAEEKIAKLTTDPSGGPAIEDFEEE